MIIRNENFRDEGRNSKMKTEMQAIRNITNSSRTLAAARSSLHLSGSKGVTMGRRLALRVGLRIMRSRATDRTHVRVDAVSNCTAKVAVEVEANADIISCLPEAVSAFDNETITGLGAFMATVGVGEADKAECGAL